LAGHDFTARSCCDLELQSSNPNVARDTSYQYGDHFCEIFLKSDFKYQSYEPDTILLQDRTVTLTFKVGTQMLRATRRLNMVVISVNEFRSLTLNNKVIGRTRMGHTDGLTDGRTRRRLYAPPKFFGEHKKCPT